MILSKKRITKVLIRLRGCAGWSAPVLFANPRRQVFSRQGPNIRPLALLCHLKEAFAHMRSISKSCVLTQNLYLTLPADQLASKSLKNLLLLTLSQTKSVFFSNIEHFNRLTPFPKRQLFFFYFFMKPAETLHVCKRVIE